MPERGPIELTVIVPCFNEEGNIAELTARVLRVFEVGQLEGELVLVDDGSSDGTKDAIAEQQALHPDVVRGVIHPDNRGIAEGWRSGAAAARGRLCAIIDADLQYQPEDLLRMRRALFERSVDIVQGWRSAVGREKGPRWYYSRGFNWLLNATFSMDLSDNKSGFLICAREVLLDLLDYRGSYRYWQAFIMVAAKAKGYSYHEIETLFMSRMAGTSFLEHQAIKVSLLCFVDLTKAAWEYRLARRPPDVAQRFVQTSAGGAESTGGPPTSELVKAYLASASSLPRGGRTGDVGHYLSAMQRTAEADPSALTALQNEKLRRLVRHAYRDVPYYRQRMNERD
ncbi:MAG TPA: glycosyltransferase, partial [Polyangiaceae bacterium]|nr:glycosyltransferase [Polyangiaceae bacterium]